MVRIRVRVWVWVRNLIGDMEGCMEDDRWLLGETARCWEGDGDEERERRGSRRSYGPKGIMAGLSGEGVLVMGG